MSEEAELRLLSQRLRIIAKRLDPLLSGLVDDHGTESDVTKDVLHAAKALNTYTGYPEDWDRATTEGVLQYFEAAISKFTRSINELAETYEAVTPAPYLAIADSMQAEIDAYRAPEKKSGPLR